MLYNPSLSVQPLHNICPHHSSPLILGAHSFTLSNQRARGPTIYLTEQVRLSPRGLLRLLLSLKGGAVRAALLFDSPPRGQRSQQSQASYSVALWVKPRLGSSAHQLVERAMPATRNRVTLVVVSHLRCRLFLSN